jgi:hypothetical protein
MPANLTKLFTRFIGLEKKTGVSMLLLLWFAASIS